jgi:hypothetical protein
MPTIAPSPRAARVGDLLPRISRRRVRRLEATAYLLPGSADAGPYIAALQPHADDFAAWDGELIVADADGERSHRLLILDRYGQVYAIHDADEADELPDANALEEWFRFLATACPECGVIDDPVLSGPTP